MKTISNKIIRKLNPCYDPSQVVVEEHSVDNNKTIDWGQRRYEIAKECLAADVSGCISGHVQWTHKTSVEEAIIIADELIQQLQKSPEN